MTTSDPRRSAPIDLPRVEAAARFERPLLGAAAGAALLFPTAIVGDIALRTTALMPLAVYAVMLAAALFAGARLTSLRRRLAQAQNLSGRDAGPPAAELAAAAPATVESEPPAAEPAAAPPPSPEAALERFGREGVGALLAVAGAVAFGGSLLALSTTAARDAAGEAALLSGLALWSVAFLLLVASRWSQAIPPDELPEAPGLAEWYRGAQWLALLTGAGLLARGLGFAQVPFDRWLRFVLLAVCAICALEMMVRGLGRLLRPPAAWDAVEAPVRLISLGTLFHGRGPFQGILEVAESRLGLSLRSAWAIGFLRRSAGPLGAGMLLALWAASALVVIGPGEQGVRLRLGRRASRQPLPPGLALKLPWPLETVERYPVARPHTVAVGSSGPQRASLLWTQTHAGEEFNLLLGDGRELVAVDALVTYRIRDVMAHTLGFQNPSEILSALAYRVLLQEVVATDLDRLLSVDRAQFARTFAVALQTACDAQGLGVEILHAAFISLHPPVGVAAAYQGVVSAHLQRHTITAQVQGYRQSILPEALAQADALQKREAARAAERRAEATGDAASFMAARRGYQTSPDLYRFRRRLETLEQGAADLNLYVVDPAVATGAGELWIDLRPGSPVPPGSGGIR
jgi:regulator of protease activity HflC (stomatin/prohibitin superfamily)